MKRNPKGFVFGFHVEWTHGIDFLLDELKQCETREDVYALLMNEMSITFVADEREE